MSYAYFHRDGKGAWHGYDAKTNAAIEAARPLEATLTLSYPDNPEKYRTFEIRFGAKAVSRRLKSPPTSGIIQVNVADENTRVVEPRDGGDFVVCGDGRRDLALRVTATQIRVS